PCMPSDGGPASMPVSESPQPASTAATASARRYVLFTSPPWGSSAGPADTQQPAELFTRLAGALEPARERERGAADHPGIRRRLRRPVLAGAGRVEATPDQIIRIRRRADRRA